MKVASRQEGWRVCVKLKPARDGRVADYAREFGLTYLEGQQPLERTGGYRPAMRDANELDVDARAY